MTSGLLILVAYVVVLLGIAYYASTQDKKNIKDFATGGGFGIFILTLTSGKSASRRLFENAFSMDYGTALWVGAAVKDMQNKLLSGQITWGEYNRRRQALTRRAR